MAKRSASTAAYSSGSREVLLHAPDEVHHAQRGGHVDQPVQPLPAREAQPADHALVDVTASGTSSTQRDEADGDEGPLDDVLPDRAERRAPGRAPVHQEVQRGVEEGQQAQLAADPHRPRPAEDEPAAACRPASPSAGPARGARAGSCASAIGLAPSAPRGRADQRCSSGARPPTRRPGLSQGCGRRSIESGAGHGSEVLRAGPCRRRGCATCSA